MCIIRDSIFSGEYIISFVATNVVYMMSTCHVFFPMACVHAQGGVMRI